MSLNLSDTTASEEFELSDVAPSRNPVPRDSQSPELALPTTISPVSPPPTTHSPTAPSTTLQSLAPSPTAQPFPTPEPGPDESFVVSTPQSALLQGRESPARVQKPQKDSYSRTTFPGLYRLSLSPWIWEITSLFVALGLLIAMIVILSRASNQPEQSWTLPIALSALVNTLSTIYRALLAYVASEVVNQEKWIWLWSTSSPLRPLRHIQSFEAGSRGIIGALKLMPLVAKSSLPSLLALLVVVLSLAVGPFAQQSIDTDYRATETGITSLPVSYSLAGSPHDFYFRTHYHADNAMWSLKASVRRALFSALANPTSNDSAITFDCPTGNCEFPSWGAQDGSESESPVTHASIGMCTSCHDVSSIVTTRTDSGTLIYALENYTQIDGTRSATPWLNVKSENNLTWAERMIPFEIAAQMRWSFTNTTVLAMAPAADQNKTDAAAHPSAFVAVTCSLYPCLRTYSASIRSGRLLEKEVGSTPLYPDLGAYNGSDVYSQILYGSLSLPQSELTLAAIQSPCRIKNSIFTTENMSIAIGAIPVRILDPRKAPDYPTIMAPDECTFRMNSSAFTLLSAVYSEQFLNGNCSWNSRQGFEIACPESWWLAQFWEAKTASVQSIKDRFSAIADAATHQFRLGIGRMPNTIDKVYGVALEQVGYTFFRWQWFLLPALLLGIDVFLLGWMLYRSIHRRGEEMAWKGNLLPLLYYRSLFEGADGEPLETQAEFDVGKEAEGHLLTAEELEDTSKRVLVRLRRGNRHVASDTEETSVHAE